MIILKHLKVGDVSYVSHKDTLKVLQRGLIRAKVDVRYSQGYVPHMLTYTTTPVPLGVQSYAEYFAVECSGIDKDELLCRFNDSMPYGMRAVASYCKDKNPNLAALVVASDYTASCGATLSKEIENIAGRDTYVISTFRKGEVVEKDIAKLVHYIKIDGNQIHMRLATGNENLRADSLISHINEQFGCNIKVNDIIRTAQLINCGGVMSDAEVILR